jgi:hypothetical protein
VARGTSDPIPGGRGVQPPITERPRPGGGTWEDSHTEPTQLPSHPHPAGPGSDRGRVGPRVPAHAAVATGSRHPATNADSWHCRGSCKTFRIPRGAAEPSPAPQAQGKTPEAPACAMAGLLLEFCLCCAPLCDPGQVTAPLWSRFHLCKRRTSKASAEQWGAPLVPPHSRGPQGEGGLGSLVPTQPASCTQAHFPSPCPPFPVGSEHGLFSPLQRCHLCHHLAHTGPGGPPRLQVRP